VVARGDVAGEDAVGGTRGWRVSLRLERGEAAGRNRFMGARHVQKEKEAFPDLTSFLTYLIDYK
jgi:hypothetical protein